MGGEGSVHRRGEDYEVLTEGVEGGGRVRLGLGAGRRVGFVVNMRISRYGIYILDHLNRDSIQCTYYGKIFKYMYT